MGDQIFEVEEILSDKIINNKKHYLVKWKNYPKEEATWEPIENMINCTAIIENYLKKTTKKSARKKKPPNNSKKTEKITILGCCYDNDGNIRFAIKKENKNIFVSNEDMKANYLQDLLKFYETHLVFKANIKASLP